MQPRVRQNLFTTRHKEDKDQIALPIDAYTLPLLNWIIEQLGFGEVSSPFEAATSPAQRQIKQ